MGGGYTFYKCASVIIKSSKEEKKMPIFYEEITIDAKLTKEQCYSVQNFEVVVPRGKRIKLRKPLQTDVFFITENENIIWPLR